MGIRIHHDGEIQISVGKNRKELNWKNKLMLWSEFVSKVSATVRTSETYNEYITSNKSRQDEIKDVGGFVGGSLAGGRRKHDTVLNRNLICLDVDHATNMDVWESYKMLYGNAAVIYTTHKHTSEKPRFRLIIPLKNEISKDRYEPIARKIADDLGIDSFDDTTFEVSRLMYWPSTSKDGEFIFDYCDDEWLEPADVLNRYLNWKDSSSWALSSRIDKIIQRAIKKQGDPLEKPGIIGAFCRAYTIQEAIDTFLTDDYEACEGGRYTYKHGSTTAGLVCYEDKFAYSHHGTDPTSGKLCNVFDLVRLHKYGLMDEDSKESTAPNRLPSYTAMVDFCAKDKKTKSLMVQEKLTNINEDFKDLEFDEDNSWVEKLEVDRKGRIKSTIDNVYLILENDPNLKGKLALNRFEHREVILGNPPWHRKYDSNKYFDNNDDSGIRYYIEKHYGIASAPKIADGLAMVLNKNSFHPVKDYLNNLVWDEKDRLGTLFIDYLGVKDNEYSRAVTIKSLAAAIARVFNPGCKFDYVLTLVGDQGVGKSSILKKLGMHWFSDSLDVMTGKEAYEQLQGVWIIELGELASLKKAELEQVKHFITKLEDRYRVAYGKRVENFPRQCVFFGTTNTKDFLKDPTGNRRWWPLDTMEQKPSKSIFKDLNGYEIDQIWAEAMYFYSKGEELYLPKELEQKALKKQEEHSEENEKKGLIEEYLELEVPSNWSSLDIIDRQSYIHNKDTRANILSENTATYKRNKVCVAEIWCELFRGHQKDMNKNNTKEIHNIMRKIDGWGEGKTNRFEFYGAQKAYVRI